MARATLTKTTLPGSYAGEGAALTWTAADATNKEQIVLTGGEILLAWNTDTSTAYTVTVTSVADEYGRTGDITTESIAAGAIHVFGPFERPGWLQTDGKLYFEASNAKIKFAILARP